MPLLNRKRAEEVMAEAGIDALVATNPDNVRYLSDYDCVSHRITPSVHVFAVLPQEQGSGISLVVPSLEVDAWAEQPGEVSDIAAYGTLYRESRKADGLSDDDARIFQTAIEADTWESALDGLKSIIERRRLSEATLGLDESGLDPRVWKSIVSLFPKATIVPAASTFRTIRMIKTTEEIARLERAISLTEEAIRAVYALADEGITERQLADCFKAEVSRHGGTPQFWIICGGRRTAHTHPRASDYALRPGDLLKLDVGCTYEGYWSDIGRTKVLGQPSDQQQQIHGAVLSGLRAAIGAIRPGIRASDLFAAAVEAVREAGLKSYRRHHCGHGIGMSVYDSPVIQASQYAGIYGFGDEDPVLEAGMVINLETPYYLLGDFGFIVEDTVVVEQAGARQITTLDHEFQLC